DISAARILAAIATSPSLAKSLAASATSRVGSTAEDDVSTTTFLGVSTFGIVTRGEVGAVVGVVDAVVLVATVVVVTAVPDPPVEIVVVVVLPGHKGHESKA
ncbi:MAG: hypothetical protein ACKPBF_09930, partial [Actinomycetota bacterium]